MSENVYWVLELAINRGRFEDFKTLETEMVEATERNEMGTLSYEYTISDDREVCHIYERYQDSAAAMTHLETFGVKFATRFMDVLKPTRFVIYGSPSAQVKEALAGMNPVYMAPFKGFNR